MFFVNRCIPSLLIFLCSLLIPPRVIAEGSTALLQQAEKAYSEGRFVDAREILQKSEEESGELLYNRGVVELQLGERARALLLFRRAVMYLPRDKEVKKGLALARESSGSEVAFPEKTVVVLPRHFFSVLEIEWILLGSVALTSLLASFFLFGRRRVGGALGGSSLITLWLLIDLVFGARDALGNPLLRWSDEYHPAVVVQQTTLFQAPAETAQGGSSLPSGTEVLLWMPGGEWAKILGKEEGWIRLSRPEKGEAQSVVILREEL